MKTCEGNVGRVVAKLGGVTLEWLARHGIEYDEIHFGKPHAQIYIDDNALRFESWEVVAGDGSSLPVEHRSEVGQQDRKARRTREHIVIPMAGRGSRFADVGFERPKPLIDVRGRPMYAWGDRRSAARFG